MLYGQIENLELYNLTTLEKRRKRGDLHDQRISLRSFSISFCITFSRSSRLGDPARNALIAWIMSDKITEIWQHSKSILTRVNTHCSSLLSRISVCVEWWCESCFKLCLVCEEFFGQCATGSRHGDKHASDLPAPALNRVCMKRRSRFETANYLEDFETGKLEI